MSREGERLKAEVEGHNGHDNHDNVDGVVPFDLGAFLAHSREDLVALAYVVTGSQEEAQDIAHDVYLRLMRAD